MNDFRRNIVIKAFKKLDLNDSGYITMEDINGIYNAR